MFYEKIKDEHNKFFNFFCMSSSTLDFLVKQQEIYIENQNTPKRHILKENVEIEKSEIDPTFELSNLTLTAYFRNNTAVFNIFESTTTCSITKILNNPFIMINLIPLMFLLVTLNIYQI